MGRGVVFFDTASNGRETVVDGSNFFDTLAAGDEELGVFATLAAGDEELGEASKFASPRERLELTGRSSHFWDSDCFNKSIARLPGVEIGDGHRLAHSQTLAGVTEAELLAILMQLSQMMPRNFSLLKNSIGIILSSKLLKGSHVFDDGGYPFHDKKNLFRVLEKVTIESMTKTSSPESTMGENGTRKLGDLPAYAMTLDSFYVRD